MNADDHDREYHHHKDSDLTARSHVSITHRQIAKSATAKGEIHTITDAKGNTTRYGYMDTHLSLVNHIHKADDTHIRLDYDNAGRLITHTDEFGNQTHYVYNSHANIKTKTQANIAKFVFLLYICGLLDYWAE